MAYVEQENSSDHVGESINATESSAKSGHEQTQQKGGKGYPVSPGKVLHVRGLPYDTTEEDLTLLAAPFGQVTNLLLLNGRGKGQAFVEMADVTQASALLDYYYGNARATIKGQPIFFQFSNRKEITAPTSSPKEQQQRKVLLVTIKRLHYVVTIDVLYRVFQKYGEVVRIVVFRKSAGFQSLIEFSDVASAVEAKKELDWQNIYDGCCTMHVRFSTLDQLTVKYNNDRSYDFTDPSLPSGPNRSGTSNSNSSSSPSSYHVPQYHHHPPPHHPAPHYHYQPIPQQQKSQQANNGNAPSAEAGANNTQQQATSPTSNPTSPTASAPQQNSSAAQQQQQQQTVPHFAPHHAHLHHPHAPPPHVGPHHTPFSSHFPPSANPAAPQDPLHGSWTPHSTPPMYVPNQTTGMFPGFSSPGFAHQIAGGGASGSAGSHGSGAVGGAHPHHHQHHQGGAGGAGGHHPHHHHHHPAPAPHHHHHHHHGRGSIGPGPVLLASGLNAEKANCDVLFTLFGVYGDVLRVKQLYNKPECALIQFVNTQQAETALNYLHGIPLYGHTLSVCFSKYRAVSSPKSEDAGESDLTRDYSGSPLHRYKVAGSKNFQHICPPSTVLHLSNIPGHLSEQTVQDLFTSAGFQLSAFKFFPHDSNAVRKMALAELPSLPEAIHALIALHNFPVPNEESHIRVTFSKQQSISNNYKKKN